MKKLAIKAGVKIPEPDSKPPKLEKKSRTKTLKKEIEKMNQQKEVAKTRKRTLQSALQKIIRKKEEAEARKKTGRR